MSSSWKSMAFPCRLLKYLPEDKQDASTTPSLVNRLDIQAISWLTLQRRKVDKNKTISTNDRNQPSFRLSREVIYLSSHLFVNSHVRQGEPLISQTYSPAGRRQCICECCLDDRFLFKHESVGIVCPSQEPLGSDIARC